MLKYSEIIIDYIIVSDCYPNFGIGDFVAGTTPVALIEQIIASYKGFRPITFTDELVFHHPKIKV